jgi:hypothetical protein
MLALLLLAFSLGGSIGFVAGCIWHSRFGHRHNTADLEGFETLSIDQPRL